VRGVSSGGLCSSRQTIAGSGPPFLSDVAVDARPMGVMDLRRMYITYDGSPYIRAWSLSEPSPRDDVASVIDESTNDDWYLLPSRAADLAEDSSEVH